MARVYVPNQLRSLTGSVDHVTLSAATVAEAIAALDERFPGIAAHLMDDEGLVRGLAVSIDGSFSPRGALAKLGESSEVHFLPAIGGG